MSEHTRFPFICLALLPPAILLFLNSITVITVIGQAPVGAFLVMLSIIVFAIILLAGGGTMIWSVFQSRKGLFLSTMAGTVLSLIPMLLLMLFLVGFTLLNYRPAEAAQQDSVIERVWGKTPFYPHIKPLKVALSMAHALKSGNDQALDKSNQELEKLLVENMDLKSVAARKNQTHPLTTVSTSEAVEMLRIIQLLSVQANETRFINCKQPRCTVSFLYRQDLKPVANQPEALAAELKERGYIAELAVNESGASDGKTFIITDMFKIITAPGQLSLSKEFAEYRVGIYSVLRTAVERRTFSYQLDQDMLDFDAQQGDGFKALFLTGRDQLIVHFWGTEFLNPRDPVTNFKLGRDPQWQNHRTQVLSKVKAYVAVHPDHPVTFIGYSLGGALAQYAGYETASLKLDHIGRTSVYTYNGIGVNDEIRNLVDDNGAPLGSYDSTLLDELQMMHITTMGDVVSLIGGGHLQGKNTHTILLGDPKETAFFIRAHHVENLVAYVDENNTVFNKTFSFPRDWYLRTRTIQSETGEFLGFLLDTGRGSDEEVWFRILMSMSVTLGKSALDEQPRRELEELRKWLVYNTVTAGRTDLCRGLAKVNWLQVRHRAKLALDEQSADKLAVHFYMEVLNGNEEQVKEFRVLNARLAAIGGEFTRKPIASAGQLVSVAQEYLQLLLEAGLAEKGE